MALLDFYALENDHRELLKFIFMETDIVVYESSSKYDKDIRSFRSVDELERADIFGTPLFILRLWSKSIMETPRIVRKELKIPGYSFWYHAEGVGLMNLYLDGERKNSISHTHFGHWNEAGARARGLPVHECNWTNLKKLSGRIQRHIRKRAMGKLYSRPILPGAIAALEEGKRLFFSGTVHDIDSPAISEMEH